MNAPPRIPAFLWFVWSLHLLMQFPLRLICWALAPVVVMLQKTPETTPRWAGFIAPFDHPIAGDDADPMWVRWWETDLDRVEEDGTRRNDRALYCRLLRKAGMRDTRHWLVRLLQLWRNGGAGANYGVFGFDMGGMALFDYDTPNGGKLTLAFDNRDLAFTSIDDTHTPMKGAVPEAFYLRVGKRRMGWKLNYPVRGRCKWMLR